MDIDRSKHYRGINWSKHYTNIAILTLFGGIFFMCVHCIIYSPEKLETLLNKVLWLSLNIIMFCLIIKFIERKRYFR